jgi:hypothetical protein
MQARPGYEGVSQNESEPQPSEIVINVQDPWCTPNEVIFIMLAISIIVFCCAGLAISNMEQTYPLPFSFGKAQSSAV